MHRAPNGSGYVCKVHGYRYIYVDGVKVGEHIVVMEKKLGRKLRRGEIVHHRNETKTDNDPDNLVLYASQSQHIKHHYAEGSVLKRNPR